MKNIIKKASFLALILVSGQLFAESKLDVNDYFYNLTSFQAKFTQIVQQDGKVVQSSSGNVTLAKPFKFKWDYKKPEKLLLINDGRNFFNYDVDLQQVTVKSSKEISSSSLALLLNDKKDISDLFIVSNLSVKRASDYFAKYKKYKKSGDSFYQLVPKADKHNIGNASVEQIIVGFNKNKLSSFFAKDQFGETTFYFKKAKTNKNISSSFFNFKPPKGVDVLGDIK